jgi:hypothetical protein
VTSLGPRLGSWTLGSGRNFAQSFRGRTVAEMWRGEAEGQPRDWRKQMFRTGEQVEPNQKPQEGWQSLRMTNANPSVVKTPKDSEGIGSGRTW